MNTYIFSRNLMIKLNDNFGYLHGYPAYQMPKRAGKTSGGRSHRSTPKPPFLLDLRSWGLLQME